MWARKKRDWDINAVFEPLRRDWVTYKILCDYDLDDAGLWCIDRINKASPRAILFLSFCFYAAEHDYIDFPFVGLAMAGQKAKLHIEAAKVILTAVLERAGVPILRRIYSIRTQMWRLVELASGLCQLPASWTLADGWLVSCSKQRRNWRVPLIFLAACDIKLALKFSWL